MMNWLAPSLFYLIGLLFFSNFWVKASTILKESISFTMSERERKIGQYSKVFFRGFFSLIDGCAIIGSYAMEILNLPDLKYLPKSIKMFSIPFIAILIITGMICYYTSYQLMYIVRNLVRMITKNEEKALIAHEKANKIFRIFSIILILVAPILGILSVNYMLRIK